VRNPERLPAAEFAFFFFSTWCRHFRSWSIQPTLPNTLEDLPVEFCEVLALREWEGLSYKQIADVVDIPIGTVMSRLARARKRPQDSLASRGNKETSGELAVGAI